MKKVLLVSIVLSVFMSTALYAQTCDNNKDMKDMRMLNSTDCDKTVNPIV